MCIKVNVFVALMWSCDEQSRKVKTVEMLTYKRFGLCLLIRGQKVYERSE
jgi:hypothetical protein